MIDTLKGILSIVSDHLLYPVMGALFLLQAIMAFELGHFVREFVQRWGSRGPSRQPNVPGPRGATLGQAPCHPARLRAFLDFRAASGANAEAENAWLDALSERLARRTDRTLLIAKLSPLLGLAGTLIPLGPALREVSRGSVAGFSDNMVVAFATTVAGLAVAALAHWIWTVRSRWYENDLDRLESLLPTQTSGERS